jgi:glycosyltransferase involved in cell wall biosynthesis
LARAALDLLPSCQVVINDNSDDDSLRCILGDSIADPRVAYHYQPGMLSVVDNFNATLARSTGEYITILGDDDMIGPHFQEFVLRAKSERIDALMYRSTRRVVHYFWPGVRSPRWGDMGGKLYTSRFSGTARLLDVQKAIRDAVNHLGEGPRHMPRIYLGLISSALLKRVQDKYGALFGGFSPDVFSSHLLATECTKAVVVDYPFILPGACPKSTSSAQAERSNRGPGQVADNHLGRFTSTTWDPRIPNYYSSYTVWSQSLIQAREKTGYPIPLHAFGYLYATCLFFTFHLARRNLGVAIRLHGARTKQLAVTLHTLLAIPRVAMNYVLRRIPAALTRRPGGARHVVSGLENARVALEELGALMGKETPVFCKRP